MSFAVLVGREEKVILLHFPVLFLVRAEKNDI